MAERTCEQCSLAYLSARATQRFCSRACRVKVANAKQRARRQPPPLVRSCPVCAVQFSNRRRDAATCSPVCARRFAYEPRDRWHEKSCGSCGTTFSSKRSDAIYCSRRCFTLVNYDSAVTVARARSWATANPERVRAIKMRNKLQRKRMELASPGVSTRDWLRMLNRYGGRCAYCGSAGEMHMDHVVPLARGGRHQIGNVLPACVTCNLSKSARLLAAWKRGR